MIFRGHFDTFLPTHGNISRRIGLVGLQKSRRLNKKPFFFFGGGQKGKEGFGESKQKLPRKKTLNEFSEDGFEVVLLALKHQIRFMLEYCMHF